MARTLTILVSWTVMLCMLHAGGAGNTFPGIHDILLSLFESLVIYLPFVYLSWKWQWILWLPVIAVPLFVMANLLYFRNFQDFIPGYYYTDPPINGFVTSGAVSSLKAVDIIVGMCALATVVAMVAWWRGSDGGIFPRRLRLCYLVATGAVAALCVVSSICRGEGSSPAQRIASVREKCRTGGKNSDYLVEYSLFGYVAKVVKERITLFVTVSPSEADEIEARLTRGTSHSGNTASSLYRSNRGRNLILIVVESLNTTALTGDISPRVAPLLTSLMNDTSVIVVPEVRQQAFKGRSSDGQFHYNTGLLPLRDFPLVELYGSIPYPSLAKALDGYAAVEVTGESSDVWNHSRTTRAYGYDRLVDGVAIRDGILMEHDADSIIFQRAFEIQRTLREPYLLEITTLTMHGPYSEHFSKDPGGLIGDVLRDAEVNDRNYLLEVAWFDRCLGRYLEALKEAGIYDRSVIVVVSDHEASRQYLSPGLRTDFFPLLVINSGKGFRSTQQREQADVFPTLLDVMGVEKYIPAGKSFPYRGFGTSVFDTVPAVVTSRDWQLSSLIIRGTFFR